MKPRDVRVWYTCYRCGEDFFLMQSAPGQDEDVTLCWTCIDRLFGK